MKLVVRVTKEDIDGGIRSTASSCMVARAFNRATEGAFPIVTVSPAFITYYADENHWRGRFGRVKLPTRVGMKIRRWDAARTVRPFEFEVDVEPLG